MVRVDATTWCWTCSRPSVPPATPRWVGQRTGGARHASGGTSSTCPERPSTRPPPEPMPASGRLSRWAPARSFGRALLTPNRAPGLTVTERRRMNGEPALRRGVLLRRRGVLLSVALNFFSCSKRGGHIRADERARGDRPSSLGGGAGGDALLLMAWVASVTTAVHAATAAPMPRRRQGTDDGTHALERQRHLHHDCRRGRATYRRHTAAPRRSPVAAVADCRHSVAPTGANARQAHQTVSRRSGTRTIGRTPCSLAATASTTTIISAGAPVETTKKRPRFFLDYPGEPSRPATRGGIRNVVGDCDLERNHGPLPPFSISRPGRQDNEWDVWGFGDVGPGAQAARPYATSSSPSRNREPRPHGSPTEQRPSCPQRPSDVGTGGKCVARALGDVVTGRPAASVVFGAVPAASARLRGPPGPPPDPRRSREPDGAFHLLAIVAWVAWAAAVGSSCAPWHGWCGAGTARCRRGRVPIRRRPAWRPPCWRSWRSSGVSRRHPGSEATPIAACHRSGGKRSSASSLPRRRAGLLPHRAASH